MAGEPDRGGDWGGAGLGWSALTTLLGGLLVWGGIGYALDRLFDFRALFLPIGLVLGFVGGAWLVIVRYGGHDKK
jgi:ATP synthase protein I